MSMFENHNETVIKNQRSDGQADPLVIRQPQSIALNEDCMEYMKNVPDKFFALAICDPPYGIGYCNDEDGIISRGKPQAAKLKLYKHFDDTERPPKEYFDELRRISQDQIIFGAQHYTDLLPKSSQWIIWDKIPSGCDKQFSGIELAWTSFEGSIRRFTYKWQGMLQGNMKNKEKRIHPTQKPIELYRWIIENFAEQGNILDTHLGSGSSRIACHKAGLDFVGCEIDSDYFQAQEKRFNEYLLQLPMQFAAV